MTREADFKQAMVHAEALAAAMRDAGLRTAKAWGRQGVDVRVYFADQYVSVSRGGDVGGQHIAPGTRRKLTFDVGALYPAQRKAFAAALTAYRAQRDAYLEAQAAAAEDSYRMEHRPSQDGVQAHNLRSPEAPPGLLDEPQHYTGFPGLLWQFRGALTRVQGNPDAPLTIFRAAPTSVRTFRRGDWVTLSPGYARDHVALLAEGGHVLEVTVPARTVRFAGDDLMEWGYWGSDIPGKVRGGA